MSINVINHHRNSRMVNLQQTTCWRSRDIGRCMSQRPVPGPRRSKSSFANVAAAENWRNIRHFENCCYFYTRFNADLFTDYSAHYTNSAFFTSATYLSVSIFFSDKISWNQGLGIFKSRLCKRLYQSSFKKIGSLAEELMTRGMILITSFVREDVLQLTQAT